MDSDPTGILSNTWSQQMWWFISFFRFAPVRAYFSQPRMGMRLGAVASVELRTSVRGTSANLRPRTCSIPQLYVTCVASEHPTCACLLLLFPPVRVSGETTILQRTKGPQPQESRIAAEVTVQACMAKSFLTLLCCCDPWFGNMSFGKAVQIIIPTFRWATRFPKRKPWQVHIQIRQSAYAQEFGELAIWCANLYCLLR